MSTLAPTPTKSQFITTAPSATMTVSGQPIASIPKMFSTGSVGYHFNGKVTLPDGTRLQITGNAVAIGSKDWPK